VVEEWKWIILALAAIIGLLADKDSFEVRSMGAQLSLLLA